MFETIDPEDLARACGGINMKLTQYGYRDDPYMDSNTAAGRGAYRNLSDGESIALTDSALARLGLTKWQVRRQEHWVQLRLRGGGCMERRIDDRAPQREMRADLYMPQGFDRRLPDYADVSLLATPSPGSCGGGPR